MSATGGRDSFPGVDRLPGISGDTARKAGNHASITGQGAGRNGAPRPSPELVQDNHGCERLALATAVALEDPQ